MWKGLKKYLVRLGLERWLENVNSPLYMLCLGCFYDVVVEMLDSVIYRFGAEGLS